jgi:hypothetical protein
MITCGFNKGLQDPGDAPPGWSRFATWSPFFEWLATWKIICLSHILQAVRLHNYICWYSLILVATLCWEIASFEWSSHHLRHGWILRPKLLDRCRCAWFMGHTWAKLISSKNAPSGNLKTISHNISQYLTVWHTSNSSI